MKILHITSEFTKKNFSIASLIVYISNYLHNKFNINFSILVSHYERELFNIKNTETIKFDNFFNYFLKIRTLINKISNYEIIHIHGIWAPIQVISIIVCNLYRKNYVIHPHGMLLNEALKSTGASKFFLKKIFLFCFKYLISNKAKFLAITNQEYNAIKIFFPFNKISIISNPIPFEKQDIRLSTKKKQFVYFGRIHPHKNIDLIIDAFKASNLDTDWKLKIYGIKDDLKYYNKLKKLIKSDPRIEIHDPIFGKEKQLTLHQSWMNILVSKSEVLSLSILEAGMCSLPSLVNEKIELANFGHCVMSTEASVQNIKHELEISSNWSLNERLEKGNIISQEIDKLNSIDKISSKYHGLYQEIIKEREERNVEKLVATKLFFNNKKFLFLILTGNYTFNLLLTSFVVITLVIFGHFSLAGELGLVGSFWITVTQIFSSNMRSIVISESNIGYALITMVYRLFFSILFFILTFFLIEKLIILDNYNLVITFSLLILVQWIFEMYLAICEVRKKYFIFKFLSIINFMTSFTTIILLYFSEFDLLIYLINLYIIIIIAFFIFHYFYFPLKFKFVNFNLRTIIKLNIQTIAFLSSFAIVISSFIWRILIYLLFDKSLAGLFFACFSIGSFPGTVFNTIIGPTYIKEKIIISKFLKIILLFLFFTALIFFFLSSYFVFNNNFVDYLNIKFASFTISISLLGSFFMCYAMYLRHKKIEDSSSRTNLFQTDVIYGFSVTFIIPTLYYLGNEKAVSFSFFLASLVALMFYSKNFKLKI